ncbi:uncharacterized protein A4U43_C08F30610 [Asparagus officinalis]|uniref:SNF1-related protein kinase regulatory subunit beta-1-like n=1 Tax=Asparagus officinalis TaxID=4686 RepID=UPI00098E0196|nr:SNF1-related protein kinase regulatory subunit beta-1-like [Asparagus officinalis]ONK61506.1 uncharacterized protein A4U43_C08F30610 [Asparagus officinalis]
MGNNSSAKSVGLDGQDSDGGEDRRPEGSDNPAAERGRSPPESPRRSQSPFLFAPQVPIAPLQRPDASPPAFNHLWMNDDHGHSDTPTPKGIPTLISWNYGGNEVAVEGSWDNWKSRRALHRSGKDHSILLVLPSGIYHYKFIVDGEFRHIPDLPFFTDENGQISNILDVNDIIPENIESVKEFEPPPSPFTSYAHPYPEEEEFAKDPPALPPQLHLNSLGPENSDDESDSVKPQHVILNHLFIEKGWAARSVVALGLTHRYRSKYVTVVLYKPLQK